MLPFISYGINSAKFEAARKRCRERDDDGDGKREQEKSNRLNQGKTKVLQAQNTFLYISVPSFHDYKVKFPLRATFYGGIKKA